jgi:ribonuclease G
MTQEILVNVTSREVRVALIDHEILQEVYIERTVRRGIIGNIYKGKIKRLLPGIQAAFVDIGLDRSAFLHVSDITTQPDQDIRDVVRPGQEILVQVYKDPLGSKGARLTTQFTIPARYLVFTPGIFNISVSQKVVDEQERARLMMLTTPSEAGGYIFRTVAEKITQNEIAADKSFLEKLWKEIQGRTKEAKPGTLIYEEIPITLRVLRDLASYSLQRIRVDDEETAVHMREFAKHYVPNLVDAIEYYSSGSPIFDVYSVENEIQKALQRKIHLKSGGYLVFDQTEAMTTVDVNTGSFTGHTDLEQTILKTNLEAAVAIARQVRLRNLGGIIIIDFIDMEDSAHKNILIQSLTDAVAKDHVRVEISELSSLGLVQMTRKRTRESLEHILCVTCPLCKHRGVIKSYATITSEIYRELKRVAETFPWPGFLVLTSQRMVDYLQEEIGLFAELEEELGKPIKLQVEGTYTQEQYDILPLSE